MDRPGAVLEESEASGSTGSSPVIPLLRNAVLGHYRLIACIALSTKFQPILSCSSRTFSCHLFAFKFS